MRNFYTAYHTDIGIKKKVNQDSLLLMEISNGNDDILLAVLCDGMGGMAKGELASATVIRAFSDWFMNVYPKKGTLWSVEDIKQQWHRLLKESNEKLIAYGNENHIELGTTVTAALLEKDLVGITSISKNLQDKIKDTIEAHNGKPEEKAKIEIDLSYTEHMLILLMLSVNQTTYMQRMQNLIQLEGAAKNDA